MIRWWIVIMAVSAMLIGGASGLASAVFLVVLERATDTQTDHPWLLFGLPLAGAGIAWLYAGIGRSAAGGNNLILDQIHDADIANRVPLRMFPLVLFATVATHLFGGSAGREGTAVQMGGAIAAWFGRTARLPPDASGILLMCGVSGGFSGVFGTPLAGTIFGMEVLAIGGMRYGALIPCLVSAIAADLVVNGLDVHHSHYAMTSALPDLTVRTVVLVAVAGVAFGLASLVFSESVAMVERLSRRAVASPVVRTFAGGWAVVTVTLLLGTRMYNGLSLPLLADAFTGMPIPAWAFAIKLGMTALTLGVGFKGGEVTPLFVIGATLGVSLAPVLGLPPDVLAALGFVAVFAAAANTPIACVVMGAELFDTSGIALFGIAVFVAYTISGHRGIYHAQRIATAKHGHGQSSLVGQTLGEIAARRTPLRRSHPAFRAVGSRARRRRRQAPGTEHTTT